ncbi:MAG: hypothetical protein ACYC6G_13665 [Desulfobaccales bacterium]
MAPRISVCRKGDDIFLTIEGGFTDESFQELLSAVRQLLLTSLKCATPGSQVTFCLKTRGKVDLDKMFHFRHMINDQPCSLDDYVDIAEEQKLGVATFQEESPQRQPRNGLILVKGGAL